MPILRSLPLLHTFRTPHFDLKSILPHENIAPTLANTNGNTEPTTTSSSSSPSSLSLHGGPLYQNDYPPELFQVRTRAILDHLRKTHPPTYIYLFSLGAVVVVFIVFLITALALQVSDGKPWVLGVIVIMILLFISKMTFLSRMEKANKQTLKLLQSINEQDMPRYGVLYRLRPRLIHHHHSSASSSSPSSSSSSPSTTLVVPSLPIRIAYRLNLGLPCFAIDLTTIDHIDEHSFGQYDPTLDPHASADEILARENELPTYQPKAEEGDEVQQGNTSSSSSSHVVVLCEALPPQYDDVVIEMPDQTPAATLPAAAESLNRP